MAGISSPGPVMAMDLSNKLTYPRRLFLWLLGYSALLSGCFIFFQYNREKEFKAAEMNTRLQLINTYILTELEENHDIREIELTDFHPFEDIRISIVSDKGIVLYDNSSDTLSGVSHLDREEIQEAMKYSSGYTVRRHSRSTGDYYFYSATKGDKGYIVRTAVPYSISLSTLLKADYKFLWIMGFISLGICILGYFATRRVGVHITRLKEFAENVERGTRISDTEPFPDDELGAISNHIVSLYAKLQQAYSDRDSEHKAALREHLEKERIKKQLTNNINHELKTPLASIRICIETMMAHRNLSEEKQELFLQRCLTNVDRLQRLLADVSLITRMDDGCSTIIRESVDLGPIVRGVVEERVLLAAEKGIAIENEVTGSLPMIGNQSLLEAIYNNLLDNAIAYSGGSVIRIRHIYENGAKIVLSVEDDGSGIAEEHLPRIFERFYRIDKGRSRSAGGTGLGLSIVKNAVMFHDGNITVENKNTGGLLFKITLSRNSGGGSLPEGVAPVIGI